MLASRLAEETSSNELRPPSLTYNADVDTFKPQVARDRSEEISGNYSPHSDSFSRNVNFAKRPESRLPPTPNSIYSMRWEDTIAQSKWVFNTAVNAARLIVGVFSYVQDAFTAVSEPIIHLCCIVNSANLLDLLLTCFLRRLLLGFRE